jgi:hypothetical protein
MLVRAAGIEPARHFWLRILSPVRLPVPSCPQTEGNYQDYGFKSNTCFGKRLLRFGTATFIHSPRFPGSSAVEQVTVNHRVGGSSPSQGAISS